MSTEFTGTISADTNSIAQAKTLSFGAEFGPTEVILKRAEGNDTTDQALWVAIRNRTLAISFKRYNAFISALFCKAHLAFQTSGKYSDNPETIDESTKHDIKEAITNNLFSDIRAWEMVCRQSIQGVEAYNLLRVATEVFLLLECGILKESSSDNYILTDKELSGFINNESNSPDEGKSRLGREVTFDEINDLLKTYFGNSNQLPFLRQILVTLLSLDKNPEETLQGITEGLPYCADVLQHRFSCPSMIELIWSYWHEEGMLAQSMSAVSLRFQNRRGAGDKDPLAHLELAHLRPLNNLLWGHIQTEFNRLTVKRRAYEYDHHYGITLYGKAVPVLRSVDSRSKFLAAFHNLLHRCSLFFVEDANTTVIADGFPLLNAIKEVHLVLAEGMHNQYGDLPWTARVEMLMEQWLLAQKEMGEFLRGRVMPYKETWMAQVDTMKRLQGWTDTSVSYFNDLAVFGEQLLLSVRFGNWSMIHNQDNAKNWVRYWRPEIQGYIHAYRTATGVDLTKAPVDTQPPWFHLRNRMAEQQKMAVGK